MPQTSKRVVAQDVAGVDGDELFHEGGGKGLPLGHRGVGDMHDATAGLPLDEGSKLCLRGLDGERGHVRREPEEDLLVHDGAGAEDGPHLWGDVFGQPQRLRGEVHDVVVEDVPGHAGGCRPGH
eukprot:9810534-Lingulodinium_polyedra.AAC.1